MRSPRPLVSALALVAFALCTPALAERRRSFNVPPGPLGPAINDLAAQAGIDIGGTDPALASARTRGVKGSLDTARALARLLAGTGYSTIRIDETTFRLVRTVEPAAAAPSRMPVSHAESRDLPAGTIIITASKQKATLLRFPGAVTIVSPPRLSRFGEGPISDLHMVASDLPILQTTELGEGRNKLFIRGIADSSFAGPTRSTATVYFGEVQLGYNGADPNLNLYDMQGIEILEGPQGTLYGAGSIGGIVRLTPTAPDARRISWIAGSTLSATEGGAASYSAMAVLNLPLYEDRAAIRLVGYRVRNGGYIDDVGRVRRNINSTTTNGGRAALRLTPGDGWTVDLGFVRQRIDAQDSQYSTAGVGPLSRSSAIAQPFDGDFTLLRGVVSKQWTNGLEALSATGLATQHTNARFDATRPGRNPAPLAYDTHGRNRLVTQETRFSRATPNGNSWVLGFSYIRDSDALLRELGPPGQPRDIAGVTNVATDFSVFGQASVQLTSRFSVTAGSRMTLTRTASTPVFIRNNAVYVHGRRSRRLSPLLAMNMLIEPRLAWFARYGSGFRTGGLAVAPGIGRVANFAPDTIWVVETGLRLTRQGPHGIAASATLSHARWNKIQADLIDARGFPYATNIGDAQISGLEASIDWRLAGGLTLAASTFLNRSRLANPIARLARRAGDALPVTPRFAITADASYSWVLADRESLSASGELRYVGRSYVGFGSVLNVRQGGYAAIDLSASWKKGGLSLSLGLENAAGARGNRFALGNPFGLADRNQRTPMRPRTLRLGISLEG